MITALIFPAYNEELTIEATIRSFHAELPKAHIWIIDNNSNDATGTIAQETFSSLGCLGGLIFEINKGKGNAIRRAFREIDADIYLIADADLTYPPNRVHDLILPIIEKRADLVVGDRISNGRYGIENKRPLHEFGNSLVKKLVNSLFNAKLNDILSGYRAFSRSFVKSYPVLVEGFEIETDMTLHALDKRFGILEVPIEYKDRPKGSVSKLNTFSDGARVILTIVRIFRYYKPLLFFSIISFIFCITGLILAIPVFMDWIAYKHIYHVPLAILATGLEIVATVMLAIGLILDSVSHQNKLLFELGMLKK